MPNWCECTVRLKGKDIDKVHNLLQSNGVSKEKITMSRLIPEPFIFISKYYAYMISKEEYKSKCEELNSDFYSGSIYGMFLDYLNKLSGEEITNYDKVNMLDKVVYNFDWYHWRKFYCGVKDDISDVVMDELGNYKYYTPWNGNIKFWQHISNLYKIDVEILEDEPSDTLFSKTIIEKGIITKRIIFDNELEFRKSADNLTDKETAELLLELFDNYEDLEENCSYIYLIEKYLKLINTKVWKLKV